MLGAGEAEEGSDGEVSSRELVRNSGSKGAANKERLVLIGDLALLLAVLRWYEASGSIYLVAAQGKIDEGQNVT